MSTTETKNKYDDLPDMNSIAKSIKAIKRSVPATGDGDYQYFADNAKMASGIADKITEQINESLTTLPTSLEKLKTVQSYAANIEKINAAKEAGDIDANTASEGIKQLVNNLNEDLSSTLTSFDRCANNLSDSATRLNQFSAKIDVRIKDSLSTETANHERAKSDVERDSARLATLEERYDKLAEAVDEKRGGPLDEFIAILPDEDELSELMDLGGGGGKGGAEQTAEAAAEAAAEASAAELAAAKKAVEFALKEIKKILGAIAKVIEFVQLKEIRDQVFKATQAQRKISNASAERLRVANEKVGVLDTIKATGNSMKTVSSETEKLSLTYSNFTKSLKDLNGTELTESKITNLYDSMSSYIEQVRKDNNSVILG